MTGGKARAELESAENAESWSHGNAIVLGNPLVGTNKLEKAGDFPKTHMDLFRFTWKIKI